MKTHEKVEDLQYLIKETKIKLRVCDELIEKKNLTIDIDSTENRDYHGQHLLIHNNSLAKQLIKNEKAKLIKNLTSFEDVLTNITKEIEKLDI